MVIDIGETTRAHDYVLSMCQPTGQIFMLKAREVMIVVQGQRKSDTRNMEEITCMISRRRSIGIDQKAYSYKQRCTGCGTDT